jgi:hypothetical protein
MGYVQQYGHIHPTEGIRYTAQQLMSPWAGLVYHSVHGGRER